MMERLKNTLLGAIAFGLSFSLLQLNLSIDLDIFDNFGILIGVLGYLFFSAFALGALSGFIFSLNQKNKRPFLIAGISSFGLIGGVLLPVTVIIAAILYFAVLYAIKTRTPSQHEQYIQFLLTTPYQMYGALFGMLAGSVIGLAFGRGIIIQRVRIVIIVALAFGLGGYLMGWIAPTETYLGLFNPEGPVVPVGPFPGVSPSAFLAKRMLGGFLFGALGGATLAYFLEPESENN